MMLHVAAPVAVALFAANAQAIIARVSHRARVTLVAEERAVALQAPWDDDAPEIDQPILISWAVDPLADAGEVGDRQLEQQTVPPVEIRLPPAPRADHEIDPLRSGNIVSRGESSLIA